MRGTWDDVNRRLVGALLALDLHDALVLSVPGPARRGLFGSRPGPRTRLAQVTAAQQVLVAEVWASGEQEEVLRGRGWEPPWAEGSTALFREASLSGAPALARSVVRALQTLGAEVADLEVELTREEPD